MRIDCYLSVSCDAEEALRGNIFRALELEGVVAEVKFHRINEVQAAALGLCGSPSVIIDGKDIQPADVTGFS